MEERMNEKIALIDRRRALGGVLALPAFLHGKARAEALLPIVVFRDPGCGCCHKWGEHLSANGFAPEIRDAPSMPDVKARLGVPADLRSCHTAEIGGYVIEGHVPASAIKRLLAEKPAGRGLAVPGMPAGSPGMEGGEPETYEVFLFGAGAPKVFGRFRQAEPV
jgi:hypothetical protein